MLLLLLLLLLLLFSTESETSRKMQLQLTDIYPALELDVNEQVVCSSRLSQTLFSSNNKE